MYQLFSSFDHGRNFDKISAFSQQQILHVYDTFDQQWADKLLQRGTPGAVVSDHFSKIEINGIEVYGLPLFAETITKFIIKDLEYYDALHTDAAFNFIINKKQINRFLCIKFVEFFNLKNFNYTWSGVDNTFDMGHVIGELNDLGSQSPLDAETRSFILQPIQLPKKWIDHQGQMISNMGVSEWGDQAWLWRNGVNKIISNSAVSLITESVWTQKASAFTEKTIYSILGLTFPLWIGGYQQAKELSRMGFDTFDDIIDHSYQSYDTVIERCYHAFAKNLHLLSDIDLLQKLRLQYQSRLVKNRELLLANRLANVVDEQIPTLPNHIQQIMPELLKLFRDQQL